MLKLLLARYPLILLACSFIGLAHAYPESTKDPLQVYRDEIKQSESNASQAVLDSLTPPEQENTTQSSQTAPKSSAATQTPRSNAGKAFTPSDNTSSANSNFSSNKNPWLQPNPWAKQPPNIWEKNAKVNPYANAPIPGPTPSNNTSANIPSPPNIFAPSQPTHTNNQQSNANS